MPATGEPVTGAGRGPAASKGRESGGAGIRGADDRRTQHRRGKRDGDRRITGQSGPACGGADNPQTQSGARRAMATAGSRVSWVGIRG